MEKFEKGDILEYIKEGETFTGEFIEGNERTFTIKLLTHYDRNHTIGKEYSGQQYKYYRIVKKSINTQELTEQLLIALDNLKL